MKKNMARVLLAALLVALVVGAPAFAALRPLTTPEHLRRERGPWEGVLSLGIAPTFNVGSGLISYANAVAKYFEKAYPGVLVSIREMRPYALREALAAGAAPDVVLFGAGALDDPHDWLMPLEGNIDAVRPEYLAAASLGGQAYALPVAVGGYIAVAHENTLTSGAQWNGWEECLSALSGKKNAVQCAAADTQYPLAGLIALTGGAILDDPSALPANIGTIRREFAWPDFALEKKYACYVATPYEIARLQALSSGGRIGDWEALPCEGPAYTDLLLLAGVVRPERAGRAASEDSAGRSAAAAELLVTFLGDKARGELPRMGLMPVTAGEPLYAQAPGLCQIEESLAGDVVVPNVFEQSRAISSAGKGIDAASAYLRSLGWEKGGFQSAQEPKAASPSHEGMP